MEHGRGHGLSNGFAYPQRSRKATARVTDALEVGPNLQVGVQVSLRLRTHFVPGLACEGREEVVHGGMGEQIGRRGRGNARPDARPIRGRAIRRRRWRRRWRLGTCSRGAADERLHQPMRQRRRLPLLPGAQDLVTAGDSLLLLLHRMNGGFIGLVGRVSWTLGRPILAVQARETHAMDTDVGIAVGRVGTIHGVATVNANPGIA